MFDLRVEVAAIEGFCDMPHRVGDYFEVRSGRLYVPPGQYVCIWALSALMPALPAKERTISEANDWLPRVELLSCPDPNGRVIWRITQIPQGGTTDTHAQPQPVVAKPIGRLAVQRELCIQCGACVAICPHHPARVRLPGPLVCVQCGVAKCIPACPHGALRRGVDGRVIEVETAACTGCGACVVACPFGAIEVVGDKALVCDLCRTTGAEPLCAAACPSGTITLVRGI